MTEVLHSSPNMPMSSVQQSMKRLADEMDYTSNRAMHSSPVDLLAQYALGTPIIKKPRTDEVVSPPMMASPRGKEHSTPIKSNRHTDESDVSPIKEHSDLNRSFNDSRDEQHLNDSRADSSLNDSRAEDDEECSSAARPFPCVWLNNDGSERSDSPAIVSVVPEPACDDRPPAELDPIVVVPTEEPTSPAGEDRPFPWDAMRSRSPLSLPRCDSTLSGEKFMTPPLLKHGDVPSPDKFNFKPNGGAINIMPTRMPMEAQSPPRSSLLSAGMLPTMVPTASETEEQNMEVCPDCHKVFKRKVYLQRHMEREHWSTAKVFKCEDCAYETKHQSNLSVHRRIHTGERPYHCGLCGQRYTQGHLLKSHIRSRHGGNMEFYNLDKKSDSTRGRKSLDPKQEGKTNDKISSLLAQHAGMPNNKMNPLLPPFLGGMAPFPLRPLMQAGMPPLGMPANLPPNLIGGPRMFSLPGMPGGNAGLLSQMPARSISQAMQMHLHMPPLNSVAGDSMQGLKIPLKVPEMSYGHDEVLKLKVRKEMSPLKSFHNIKQEPLSSVRRTSADDDMAPEDLSTGRKTMSPDSGIRSPATPTSENHASLPVGGSDRSSPKMDRSYSPKSRTANSPGSITRGVTTSPRLETSMAGSPATPMERAESPEGTPVGRSSTPMSAIPSHLSDADRLSPKSERTSVTPDRLSSLSDRHFTPERMTPEMLLAAAGMPGRMPMPYPAYIQALARGELMDMSPSPEPLTHLEKSYLQSPTDRKKSQKANEYHQHSDKCNSETCPHASKLRKLRKNIMRMLSVLSPELGVDGCLDYNTDEVDEMLHEVIYSNIDEESSHRKI